MAWDFLTTSTGFLFVPAPVSEPFFFLAYLGNVWKDAIPSLEILMSLHLAWTFNMSWQWLTGPYQCDVLWYPGMAPRPNLWPPGCSSTFLIHSYPGPCYRWTPCTACTALYCNTCNFSPLPSFTVLLKSHLLSEVCIDHTSLCSILPPIPHPASTPLLNTNTCACVCMYVYIYVYVCICVCVCIMVCCVCLSLCLPPARM